MLFGMEEMHFPVGPTMVSPFVVSQPPWLVGEEVVSTPRGLPWRERKKVLFFAGHMPKLTVSQTRFRIWDQLRQESDVTAISATINCTVGAFANCRYGRKHWRAKGKPALVSFCDEVSLIHWLIVHHRN